ncbi:MAG TPA: T9SS type A sorting domain-containing protein [Bacteroidia bacterium]|nr:T9SS type A sorting domain-containing protein [Bacteroidia bacterium]
MKKIFTLLAGVVFWVNGFSQPTIQWQKCFGGTDGEDVSAIVQTYDGGYIAAGSTNSNNGDASGNHGLADYWLVKIDNAGVIQWQKCYGGTGNDYANSVIQSSDSGYVIAGISDSNDGDVSGNHGIDDVWIVKVDNNGTLQWQKCLGGTNREWTHSIIESVNGGYVLVGRTYSNNGDVNGNHGFTDMWVVKLSGIGTIQWQKCLGGTAGEEGQEIIQTSDGGYAAIGTAGADNGDVSGNHGLEDYWFVKLDSSGTIQWQRCFGGTDHDDATSVIQTSSGGYCAAGYTSSNDGDVSGNNGGYDFWVVNFDDTGNILFQKTFGGTADDFCNTVMEDAGNTYIVTGMAYSNNGDVSGNHGLTDVWVVKMNGIGILQWQKCFGGTFFDASNSFIATSDGGYAIGGSAVSNNGDVSGNHGNFDYWVVKLGPDNVGIHQMSLAESNFFLSPNPATNEIRVESSEFRVESVEVYDVLGQPQTSNLKPQTNAVDVSSLAPGIYFVKVKSKEGERAAKFVKQ